MSDELIQYAVILLEGSVDDPSEITATIDCSGLDSETVSLVAMNDIREMLQYEIPEIARVNIRHLNMSWTPDYGDSTIVPNPGGVH